MTPPLWLILPIALAAILVWSTTMFFVVRSQGAPAPIPTWWRRVPKVQRRLAYIAIAVELATTQLLLWSLESGNELPEAVRIARGLLSLAAWIVLGWVAVTAIRRRPA